MGLLDNLREIGNGVKDIFSAPVGLVYDTARAIVSEQYNPGFFGVFGGATDQLITGVSQLGEGTGLADLGRSIGESSWGPVFKTILDEGELLYSTEFQRQQNKAPIIARDLGAQPGDFSVQRVLGTGTGLVGSTVGTAFGGDPTDIVNVNRQWQRSATRSPGQAFVEQAFVPGFYELSPQMQDEVRNTAWYNMVSGTIDATARWFTDPWVIAGKGVKGARSRMALRPQVEATKAAKRHPTQYADLRKMGYEIAEDSIDPETGMRMIQLKSGRRGKVLHVTRISALRHMLEEGSLDRIPPGADEVLDAELSRNQAREAVLEHWRGDDTEVNPRAVDQDLRDIWDDLDDLLVDDDEALFNIADDPEVRANLSDEARDMLDEPLPHPDFYEDQLIEWEIARGWWRQKALNGETPANVDEAEFLFLVGNEITGFDPDVMDNIINFADESPQTAKLVDFMREYYEWFSTMTRSAGDVNALAEMEAVLSLTNMGDALHNYLLMNFDRFTQSWAMRTIEEEYAGRGLLGSRIVNFGQTPRFPGTTFRPLHLLGEGDLEEAYRYAAALYQADPGDMPVILEIDANGLPVVFEDFDMPAFPDPRSGEPSDASLFTLADRIDTKNISNIIHPEAIELDTALNTAKVAPAYLEPGGRVHPRMYDPDGSPIEPDQIIPFEEIRDDFLTASYLYGQDPVQAEKYLLARQKQRNQQKVNEKTGLIDRIANHKVFQSNINWMAGKSADEIRRVLFPHTAYGGPLAVWLSKATTYAERRTIMLAAMGIKSPEFDGLEPMLRAKLAKLHEEANRVANGHAPDPMFQSMMGMESPFNDIPPGEMANVFDQVIGELEDQARLNRFLNEISDAAPIREMRTNRSRRGTNLVRRTRFYQESPLARPVRAVTEWRPHQFMNVRDSMSDIQLVRQLEEAAPLGIGADEIARYREEYMAATNEQAKVHVVERAERRIVEAAAEKAGLEAEEIEDLLSHANRGRGHVAQYLHSRRYAAGGQDKVKWVDPDTGEAMVMTLPMLSTQTQSWVPLANVKEIIRVSSKIKRVRSRLGVVPREFMEAFYQVWKPSVLLRGGWMLRVVADEQLRILARGAGLLHHIAALGVGEAADFTGVLKSGLSTGQRAAEGFATATGTRPIVGLATRAARITTKVAEKLRLIDPEYMHYLRQAGLEEMVSARASFGGQSEASLHSLQALMGRDEFTILDHLYDRGTGQWQSITSDNRLFASAWQRALVDQWGRDPLGRHIIQELLARGRFGLEAMDAQDLVEIKASVRRFLNETAEGKEIAERMPWRSKDPDKWTDDLMEVLADYTAGFDEGLLRGALDHKITREMMEGIDEALRPDIVHAEIIDQTLGTSSTTSFIRDFVSNTFDLMGRLPTDTLSRQPFFRQMYAAEMMRLRRLREAQGLDFTESAVQRMDKAARAFAIKESRDYLYDLAEVTRFGHMVRFIMPFYPAWQEVFKVWGKLAIDDPSVIARGRLLWKAPDAAGITYTDEEGEQYIQIRLSEKSADSLGLTGWQRYVATGGARIGKSAFNLVLNSPLPGAGPLIQYPVNEVVKKKPELEASLQWLLPFGVSTDSSQIFLSPLVRQLRSEVTGPDSDKTYQRAFVDALTWMDVEYRQGKRSTPPSEEEAHDVASKLFTMRLVTRLASPAQPIFDSPLKPYIDIYRDMQDNLGPELADETFLNDYGNEFFAVTLSRTVSKTGIPPTVEGEVARRQFADLIEEYPEYGRLIIGDEGIGEFSTAAYAAQLERPLDPDNPFSEMERQYRVTELDPRTGTIIEVDRRLGWQEYIQAMDQIDLVRRQRGLPNLRVNGAEDLAEAKRAVTQYIATQYPSWWEDFNTRDELKWDKRLDAFRDISTSNSLEERPDIQGLQDYFVIREAVLQELNRRKQLGGSSTMDSTTNQDLSILWETLVTELLEDNIAFGPLYYRYLEGDPVSLR